MDAGTVLNLVGSYAFPIVACIFMGWFIKYTTDKHREEIKELNADHKKEMESITSAINNLNIVTTKLYERLGEVLNERNE